MKTYFQEKNFHEARNRAAFYFLRQVGYALPKIRRALLVLNDIKYNELGSHSSNVSQVLAGKRSDNQVRSRCAEALGIPEEDLFPEDGESL